MQRTRETPPLGEWATIGEVSAALGISYDTIKQAVYQAKAHGQTWVRRTPTPAPDGPLRWQLQTSSTMYQQCEQRWRLLALNTRLRQQATTMPPDTETLSSTWSAEWCQWLAAMGLRVFVNALEPARLWQWSWRKQRGTGYPHAEAALTAALQEHLLWGEPLLTSSPSTQQTTPEPERGERTEQHQ